MNNYGPVNSIGTVAGIQSYFQRSFRPQQCTPATMPRVLRSNGNPVDPTGFVEIAKVTAYDSATGLYTCKLEGVQLPPPRYIDMQNTYTAYDNAQLAGLTPLGTQSFPVGDYVAVVKGMGVNIIISSANVVPDLFVYRYSDTSIKVTSGMILHPFNGVQCNVAASAELTVADADKVWVQRTGANTWATAAGAAFPTDKIYIPLAVVSFTAVIISQIALYWSGGDLIVNETFQVTLTQTGGSDGNNTTMATWTYNAATLAGVTLAELNGCTPTLSLGRVIPGFVTPATHGTVHMKADGTLVLWDCNEKPAFVAVQRPQTGTCAG